MALSDFHIHPDFSTDAVGSVEQFCEKALICFTTHYDYNPALDKNSGHWRYKGEKVKLTDNIVAAYLDEIETAKTKFVKTGLAVVKTGLAVYAGIEIDYTPGSEKEAERLRSLFSFDFVLGSIHCVNGYIISEEDQADEYFTGRSADQAADGYIALLKQAGECRFFDALGHLDYFIRYGRKYYGNLIDNIQIDKYDSLFENLKRNNIGIEINTSPYKRGETGFHPSEKILERAIDSGVIISSIGSDCHSPDQLGMGVNEAFGFLKSRNMNPRYPL
jgi:histidinol-phosphatase (PHP family)